MVNIISLKPSGCGVCNNFIHLNSNSCPRIYLYLLVELPPYVIFSTDWIEILLVEWLVCLKCL